MRAAFIVGRALFGGFFLYNGINHLQHAGAMGRYAAAKGVPAPDQAVKATGAMLIAGGLSVLTGIKPRQGLGALVAFLIPVTLQMHRFWEVEEAQQRQAEMTNFLKNMALVGASLAMMRIDEPWPARLDTAYTRNEEMFIRIGGRDMRDLPV